MNTRENIFDLHLISQSSEFKGHTFSSYFLPNEEESIIYLPNTNKINILIGTNNSGKSRFMRELLKMEDWYLSNDFYSNLKEYNELINFVYEKYYNFTFSYHINDYLIDITQNKITGLENRIQSIFPLLNYLGHTTEQIKIVEVFEQINKIPERKKSKKIFIPTLRSAHSIFNTNSKKIEEDFYQETLIKNYNFKTDIQKIEIFTGLHLYKKILNARNSDKENRKRFEEF